MFTMTFPNFPEPTALTALGLTFVKATKGGMKLAAEYGIDTTAMRQKIDAVYPLAKIRFSREVGGCAGKPAGWSINVIPRDWTQDEFDPFWYKPPNY